MVNRTRTRRSCEPCRRKKVKCSGERPICSYCRRLNQTCAYLTIPGRAAPERSGRQDIAGGVVSQRGNLSEVSARGDLEPSPAPASRQAPLHHVSGNATWSFDRPDPPSEVLAHYTEVYKSSIYFQPLPILALDGLTSRAQVFPRFLQSSFLALALLYSIHPHYVGAEAEAANFYAKSAQRTVDEIVAAGNMSLEVLQALCFLSLYQVKAKQSQAWMTIGSTSRLQAMARLGSQDRGSHLETDAHLRCYWSIFLLESAFTPQYTTLPQDPQPPAYPRSPPIPPSTPQNLDGTYRQGQPTAYDAVLPDLGINAYALQMAAIWGEIAVYLHCISRGVSESAWLATSTFTRLTVRLYEIDNQIHQRHLLRYSAFNSRPIHELQRDAEYWRPWVLMQFLYHGSHALLHSPFIHLHALRRSHRAGQPGFFLQKIIDQAIFHSSWVVRLLEMGSAVGFEVRDPLVGQIVATTATTLWLLQFARDGQVSRRSRGGMRKCLEFLQQTAETWPHLSYQLEILRDLQTTADERHNSTADGVDITFMPSKLWQILDYNVSKLSIPPQDARSQQTERNGNPSVTLHVATIFVHPLEEEPQINAVEETGTGNHDEVFGDLALDNFLFDYFLTDYTQQPMTEGIAGQHS